MRALPFELGGAALLFSPDGGPSGTADGIVWTLAAVLVMNLAGAAVLALVARGVDRVWSARWPALAHALWLLVLVDIVMPPVLGVAVLPAPDSAIVAPAMPSSPADASRGTVAAVVAAKSTALDPTSPVVLFCATWIAGAGIVFGLSALRSRRFGRYAARGTPAGAELLARVSALGERLGLARAPRVLLVPGRVPPLLWRRQRRHELVLPAELVARLDGAELDAVLAHELAHAARRDPWVRWIELLVTGAMWWYPVTWWARRRLRRAEELCCDAIVVASLPEARRSYATALVKTVEFLAGHASPLPDTASGASVTRDLHERLTMILQHRPRPRLSSLQKILLGVAALVVLLVLPTRAERSDDATGAGAGARASADPAREEEEARAVAAELHQAMAALEREALDLERARFDLERRRIEILEKSRALEERYPVEAMDARSAEPEAAGRSAAAADVRREHETARRTAELDRTRLELERERMLAQRKIELPLRELELKRELLLREGLEEEAAAVERSMRDMEVDLERAQDASRERELQLEHAQADSRRGDVEHERRAIELEIERLARELELLREREAESSGAR